MHFRHVSSSRTARRVLASAGIVGLALGAAACGSDDTTSGATGSAAGTEKIGVALITKDSSNPFFVAMQKGAKEDAGKQNVDLTVASGKQEGDDQGQITAIEDAIARGDKGILITPMSTGVNAAIKKARDAGLFVIALDTPPDPADTVDITFATDNRLAGQLDGKWAAATLDGKAATIALLDLFNDKIVYVDYDRDQGFLEGMGIDVADPKKNGDEAPTGKYTGGKGGDYTIVCNEPSNGAEDGGRTAMENCLSKNPAINVVYTINEPAAVGASTALKAAGVNDALIVSVDGGCAGVKSVKDGTIGATAQQYPLKMATLGMEAIASIARGGAKPTTSEGLDFFNTGVALVTDKPAEGVDSITSDEALKICWG
jgi:fructose transport system substrate-binding protein